MFELHVRLDFIDPKHHSFQVVPYWSISLLHLRQDDLFTTHSLFMTKIMYVHWSNTSFQLLSKCQWVRCGIAFKYMSFAQVFINLFINRIWKLLAMPAFIVLALLTLNRGMVGPKYYIGQIGLKMPDFISWRILNQMFFLFKQ